MKHRLMQVLSLVLAMVLLFGSIPNAFAAEPEIPVETEPPYTGTETDTGQAPPVTEEPTPPTEPEATEPPGETTAPTEPQEPPATEAPSENTEPTVPEETTPADEEEVPGYELEVGDVLVPTTVGDSQIVPMTLPPDTDLTIVKKDYYTPFPNGVTFYFYSDNKPYPLESIPPPLQPSSTCRMGGWAIVCTPCCQAAVTMKPPTPEIATLARTAGLQPFIVPVPDG